MPGYSDFKTAAATAVLLLAATSLPAQVQLKPNGQDSVALTVRSLQADITIEGSFAYTVQKLTYSNTLNSRIEADFIYTLPPDAIVTSFAYWCGAERVPARIFENAEAMMIYKQITTHQRDPAIVQKMSGNRFHVRLFPVMPNADLKVEMTLVQVLRPSVGAVTYTLPVEATEYVPLDSAVIQARVKEVAPGAQVRDNFGLATSRSGSTVTLRLERNHFEPQHALTIQVERPKRPAVVSCCSGLDHGSGYFAASIAVDHAVRQPQLRVSGDTVTDVVIDSPSRLAPGDALLVTGRYRRAGRLSLQLSGPSGKSEIVPDVVLSERPTANDIAKDLWADRRIAQLSQSGSDRREVIALSKRYRLPSRYTSWLAVPQSEMRGFWFDVAVARVQDAVASYVDSVQHGNTAHLRQQEDWITYLCLQVPLRSDQDRWLLGSAIENVAAYSAVDLALAGSLPQSLHLRRFLFRLNASVSPETNWDEVALLAGRYAAYTAHDLIQRLRVHNPDPQEVDSLVGKAVSATGNQALRSFMARDPDWQSEMAEERRIVHLLQLTATGESLANFMAYSEMHWAEHDPEVESVQEELRQPRPQLMQEAHLNWFEIASADARGLQLHNLLDARRQARAEAHYAHANSAFTGSAGRPGRQAMAEAQGVHTIAGPGSRLNGYYMRYGDPLIRITAPQDALHVDAVMPDGEVKPLTWDASGHCWQARFDVPRYAAQGDYTITVIMVARGGNRRTIAVRYHVDLTPPAGVAHSTEDHGAYAHLEIAASQDTARVKALLPWNAVVDLQPAGNNLFRAETPVPGAFRGTAYSVTYILTDRAHNRTMLQVDMAAK